jgi:hypothetical protein
MAAWRVSSSLLTLLTGGHLYGCTLTLQEEYSKGTQVRLSRYNLASHICMHPFALASKLSHTL